MVDYDHEAFTQQVSALFTELEATITGNTKMPATSRKKALEHLGCAQNALCEERRAKAPDPVNHPSHYTAGAIECIDAIKEATKDLQGEEAVCTGNALKYLWRWKRKNGKEDLRKARWYINRVLGETDAA